MSIQTNYHAEIENLRELTALLLIRIEHLESRVDELDKHSGTKSYGLRSE